MKRSRDDDDVKRITTTVLTMTGDVYLDPEEMGLITQASSLVARLIEMNPNGDPIRLSVTRDFMAECVTTLRAFLEWQQLAALVHDSHDSSGTTTVPMRGRTEDQKDPMPTEEMRVLVARMIRKIVDDPSSLYYARSLDMHEKILSMAEQVRATLTVPCGLDGLDELYGAYRPHGLTDKEVAYFFGSLPRPVQGPPLAHMLCALIIKTIRLPSNNLVALEFQQHEGKGEVQSAYICVGLKEAVTVAITSVEPDGTVTASIQKFRDSLLASQRPLAGGSTLNWLLTDIAGDIGKLRREQAGSAA
jgi:hypothetical protein